MTDLEETFRTYDFKRQENLTQKFTNILATLKFFFFTGYYTQFPTNSRARRAREVQFTERRSALAPMNSVLFATPVLQQQCYYSSVLFFNYL